MNAGRPAGRKYLAATLGATQDLNALVNSHEERRCCVDIGYDLDVYAVISCSSDVKGFIEFTTCYNWGCKPSVTAEDMRQLGITPLGNIVINDVRIFAKQAFDEIAGIIEDEYDRLKTPTSELTNLLNGELMRAFARKQQYATITSRDCCTDSIVREAS